MPFTKRKRTKRDVASELSETLYAQRRGLANLRIYLANETPPGGMTLEDLEHEIKRQEIAFEINKHKLEIEMLTRQLTELSEG